MPKTKTIIRIRAFKPIQAMKAYMLLCETIDTSTGNVIDACVFFQDLRNSEASPAELFKTWTHELNPRVKNPLTSKKFEITVAKPDEKRVIARDSFLKQYSSFINKVA